MSRVLVATALTVVLLNCVLAEAQTGGGSLVGYVKDEQGGALPGVTVTARGPSQLVPVTSVADGAGYYRLNNLAPGTVTVTGELGGFATFQREGIAVRAGTTFTVDIEMKVGSLSETITVSGESPMIETSQPASTLTIDGELLRSAPVTSRRLFSDVLDMAPGISSRNVNDGVGRRSYYFKGAVIFSHVFQIEGAPASSFLDASAHSMGLGGDAIADSELKLGGVDAASPMGTGVVMNVLTKQGGNQFKGSATDNYQANAWNSDNTTKGSAPGGVPTAQSVKQFDLSLGGPIVKNKTWFFGAFRRADLTNGISRSPFNIENLRAFDGTFEPFDNTMKSNQPFVRLTSQVNAKHQLSGFYQGDRAKYTSDRELNLSRFTYNSTGGGLYQVKMNSVWSNSLTSEISGGYNNKGGNDAHTYDDAALSGPQIIIHRDIFATTGIQQGTGGLVQGGSPQSISISPSTMLFFRGDLTYFKSGWGGSHEFKTGIWAAPRLIRETDTLYVNDGFVLQEMRQLNVDDPSAGLTPFHERYITPVDTNAISERDRDIAFYVQDGWKPHPRLTVNLGLRADFIRRHDELLGIDRMKSTAIQPRLGAAWVLTEDAHNVLRASYARLYEQVNGRDGIVAFGTTSSVTTTDVYIDKAGARSTVVAPPTRSVDPALLFPEGLHQPWVDEFVVGFRKQFSGQISVDVTATQRVYHDQMEQVDINGIYPSGPNQPFGGFGLVDPNLGIIYAERNGDWARVVVRNLEATIAKNMSHNIQAVLSVTRQWQHVDGTWNPTDPARFIQPDAFPNNHDLSTYLFTNNIGDYNTLPSVEENGAAYRPFSVRLATQYFAPWNLSIGASYVIQAGGWNGPVMTRLAAADPVFGPATVPLANGRTQPNPLATTIRFANATRGEGQTRNDTNRYLQLKIGRVFALGRHEFEPSLNIFNVFNTPANTQWNAGANLLYSPNYLQRFNRHPPRAFQLGFSYRF